MNTKTFTLYFALSTNKKPCCVVHIIFQHLHRLCRESALAHYPSTLEVCRGIINSGDMPQVSGRGGGTEVLSSGDALHA